MINAGFETDIDQSGWPDYWGIKPSTLDDAKDGINIVNKKKGNSSLKLVGSTQNKYLGQDINVSGTAGVQIMFSGWSMAQGVSSSGGTYQVLVRVDYKDPTINNGQPDWFGADFNKTNHPWEYTERSVVIPYEFKNLGIYVKLENQPNANVWFDEIVVRASSVSNAIMSEYNLAQNNSFEYDQEKAGTPDKWQLYIQDNTTANVQWLTSNRDITSFIGEHFVSFSNTGGWTVYGNKQNEPLEAGETYVATAMVRTATNLSSGGGIIKFDLYDASGNYLAEKVSKTITQSNDDWTRVLVVLTYDEAKRINNAAISIKLSIGTLAPTAGTLYFDAVNWLTKPVLTQLGYDANDNYVTSITNPLGYSVSLARTPRGNLASITLPRGGKIIYGYDLLDRPTYIENQATNAIYQIIYDKNGNILNLGFYQLVGTDLVWKSQMKQTFNERNQIKTHEDQRGNQTVYDYDANGNLELISFPNSTQLQFAYDTLDRLKTKQDVTYNKSWTFSYDKNNNLTQVIQTGNAGQEVTDYILDNLIDEVKSITYPMVNGIRRSVNYTYNANGQITTISHSPITQKLGVDAIYRYDYDQAGMMASLNGPNKEQVGQFYDEAGRLKKSFILDGTKAYNIYCEYNELGELKEYRLETADGVILRREKHAYDADGNTTIITYNDGSRHSFQYDLADRLTNEQQISSNGAVLSTISYQYDPYGNRLSNTKNGTTTTYKYDSANQISSVNGSAGIYQYDRNGNQIKDDRHKYYYDSSNRLTDLEQANTGAAIASYSYDYEGKRTKKVVYGKKTEHYYYDAGHLAYIADENNQILYSFTRTYTGDLVTMTDYTSGAAVNYYYVHNGHGDIIGFKDKTGTTVVTYEYDAFGNIITSTGTVKTGNGRLLREENPFRYASYFYDEEAKLYYLRMRYYDPLIGRYLTRDIMPSANLYVYTENNPVRFIDPLGLELYPVFMLPIKDKIPKVNRAFPDYFYVGGTTKKSGSNKSSQKSASNGGGYSNVIVGGIAGGSIDKWAEKRNPYSKPNIKFNTNAIDVLYKYSPTKNILKKGGQAGTFGIGLGIVLDATTEDFDPTSSLINNVVTAGAAYYLSTVIIGGFAIAGMPAIIGGIAIGTVVAITFSEISNKTGITPAAILRGRW